MKTTYCPDCGHEVADPHPRRPLPCTGCGHLIAPRYGASAVAREAVSASPGGRCVCCGAQGSKVATVDGGEYLLCVVCFEFHHAFNTRSSFGAYRASGGAACWLMAGKRLLLDKAPIGGVDDVKQRDIPKIRELRKRPGTFQGGVRFGYRLDGRVAVPDPEQQLTLQLIKTYLDRHQSTSAIARELTRHRRLNKAGSDRWDATSVRFLAEREGWL